MKITFATMTSEGLIQHKKNEAGFYMPVMLDIPKNIPASYLDKPMPPKRDNAGNIVFASPGF